MPTKRGRLGFAQIGIVTVVPAQMNAVQKHLGLRRNIAGTSYYVSKANSKHNYELVVMRLAERTNVASHEGTKDLIEHFRPWFIVLVDIAGGVGGRDGVALGDVIVADFLDYYEFRKIVDGKNQIRRFPFDQPSLFLRDRIAEAVSYHGRWTKRIKSTPPVNGSPKAIVGNIISGEKLLGDPKNKLQRQILNEFDKALAVDMESVGLARAVFHSRESVHYNPQYSIIRGISDLANEKGNDDTRQLWRSYAAESASAFAAEMIMNTLQLQISAT